MSFKNAKIEYKILTYLSYNKKLSNSLDKLGAPINRILALIFSLVLHFYLLSKGYRLATKHLQI